MNVVEYERVIFSEQSTISGTVSSPPSKSYSHRLLFLSLISDRSIHINNLLIANDVSRSLEACKILGLKIIYHSDNQMECIPPDRIESDEFEFECGNSGTTIRFLVGLSMVITGKITLRGNFFTHQRPILPMLDAMKSLGTYYTHEKNSITVETPHIIGNEIYVPGNISSQFISGLIYGIVALSLRPAIAVDKDFSSDMFTIRTTTPVVSFPYVLLTQHLFHEIGIDISITSGDDGCIKIIIPLKKTSKKVQTQFTIPGDFSASAPILCAGALFGKEHVILKGLYSNKLQADEKMITLLQNMGVSIRLGSDGVTIVASGGLRRRNPKVRSINCIDHPDLFPVLCVLGAYLPGTTILKNISHLRYKESDRVELMAEHLQIFGVKIKAEQDSVVIHGSFSMKLERNHTVSSVYDHRILMALSLFALGIDYNGFTITIGNINSIADSYPGFFQDLQSLGANFTLM